MSRILDLAKQIKIQSRELYKHFKAQGNNARVEHMHVIFYSAEKVRYKLEEEPTLLLPPDTWKALLAIEKMGYSSNDNFDENEKLVLPLYEKYIELKKAYGQAYGDT
ncbi:MAG: hypothetical protein ACM31P_10530 [Actinomycetota bacterium]